MTPLHDRIIIGAFVVLIVALAIVCSFGRTP